MEIIKKRFNELSIDELFDIYKVRSEVFVVEQNCVYLDIDECDKVSIHLYIKEDDKIVSYLRVLPAGCRFKDVSIGRVLSTVRRKGYATALLKEAIETAKNEFEADIITIEAQVYARELYEKLGFKQSSEEFLEDGIPHIEMKLTINNK